MSVPYLAYLENNPARPTEAALRQLAAALETSTEFLLGAGPGGRPGPAHRARGRRCASCPQTTAMT